MLEWERGWDQACLCLGKEVYVRMSVYVRFMSVIGVTGVCVCGGGGVFAPVDHILIVCISNTNSDRSADFLHLCVSDFCAFAWI